MNGYVTYKLVMITAKAYKNVTNSDHNSNNNNNKTHTNINESTERFVL